MQGQDDDNSTGKICVAKGIGNAVHYGFLAGTIFLVGMNVPPGFPLGKVDRYITEKKSRLRGDQNEAKRFDNILFLNTGWVHADRIGRVTQQIQDR